MITVDEANLAGPVDVALNASASDRALKHQVLDTTMRVTTPENISFQYQVAGPFRRVFAYGLDLLISLGGYAAFVFLVYMLMVFAVIPLATYVGGTQLVQAFMGVLAGLISVGYFIIYWFYGAYMETYFNGQTIGKRLTKMRVISANGHAIDGVQATLRNFFRLLDIMPFVSVTALLQLDEQLPIAFPTCLFGLLIMTLSKNFQRLGDLVAGTVVVNEEQKRHPSLATFLDDRVPQLAELIPANYVVPASMAQTIADYVDRRKYLPFQRASEIASHLAHPLMDKFGIAADTDHDLFLCSLYYKTFVAGQNADGYTGEILPGGQPVPHLATALPVEKHEARPATISDPVAAVEATDSVATASPAKPSSGSSRASDE